MAVFRRGALIIEPDHGIRITHRLKFSTAVPYPDDLEPVAANFTKWASPRLAAWHAQQQAIKDMGLVEDVFGLFHTPDHRPFRFDELGEGIHAGIPQVGDLGNPIGTAGGYFHPSIHGQGGLDRSAVYFHPSFHGQVNVGTAGEYSNSNAHGQGYTAGATAYGNIDGEHSVVAINSPVPLDDREASVGAGAQVEQYNFAVIANSIGSNDETRSVSPDEDKDTTFNSQADGSDHGSEDDGHTKYSRDVRSDSLAVFSNAGPGSSVISEDNPLFADLAKRLSKYKSEHDIKIVDKNNEEPFRPSQMLVDEEAGIIRPPLNKQHYRGNHEDIPRKTYKHQVKGLPDKDNAALWLEGLPPSITEADLLAVVDTGAVFALHLNRPTWKHSTSACKLVFMKVSAAHAFKKKCLPLRSFGIGNGHGTCLRLGDFDIRAGHNDNGYREYGRPGQSRVLRIHGPKELVKSTDWESWFKKCTHYKKTHSAILPSDVRGEAIYEVGFARIDGQAETIHHAVRKQKAFKGIFRVEYARDPCDPDGQDFERHRMHEARR